MIDIYDYILRKQAHIEFDRLWKEGLMSRSNAYCYLMYVMGIMLIDQAHISLLSAEECVLLIRRLRCPRNLKGYYRFIRSNQFTYIPKVQRFKAFYPKQHPLSIKVCPKCGWLGARKYFKKRTCHKCYCKMLGSIVRNSDAFSWTDFYESTKEFRSKFEAKK